MSHRVINNVGYKKIYPMSEGSDDRFCHYCGREANFKIALEWDHVPALNVRLPEDEFGVLRKTLVRACRECNALASDHPHVDYTQRHLWLKSAYLRRYKRLLLSEGGDVIDTQGMNGFLKSFIEDKSSEFEDILQAIGFGLSDTHEIDSPILDLKTVSKQTVRQMLVRYLYSMPIDDDEEPFDVKGKPDMGDEGVLQTMDVREFIEFLAVEAKAGIDICSHEEYDAWRDCHETRAKALCLPSDPENEYSMKWFELSEKAYHKLMRLRGSSADPLFVFKEVWDE